MPNLRLKISRRGKDPRQWFKEIDGKIHFEFQERLVEVANEAVQNMRQLIRSMAVRPPTSGRLENSIEAELLGSTGGIHIGIGRITSLPPYWEVLNDGGYIPPANIGFFGDGEAPRAGGAGQKWTHTGYSEYGFENNFLMTPTKAIKPMHYIELTNDIFLIPHIESEIRRLNKEMRQASI